MCVVLVWCCDFWVEFEDVVVFFVVFFVVY